MIALRTATARIHRAVGLCVATLLLAACAGEQPKPPSSSTAAPAPSQAHTGRKPWKPLGPYTPGGLYAPGVSDGAPDVPPDVANLPEPVPHPEPLSRYGNRSPYTVLGKTYTVLPNANGYVERGMASWYGTKFDGRVTSSFEPYDLSQFTAAHRTLPLPSYARVTNLENGRSVIVRINDRGPFHEGRLIDLSYAAAIKLGVNVHGTAMVEVRGIDTGQPLPAALDDAVAVKPAAARVPAVAKPPAAKAAAPRPVSSGTVASASIDTAASPVASVQQARSTAAVDALPATTVVTKPVPTTATNSSTPAVQPAITMGASDSATLAPIDPLPDTAPTTLPVAPPSVVAPAGSTAAPSAAGTVAAAMTQGTPAAVPAVPAASLVPATTPAQSIIGALPAAPQAPIPVIGHPLIDPSTQGFLQVASYGDRSNAERMLQRLQQAGIEHAELVSVQVAEQTMWRVHIGPMRADQADQVAGKLNDLGFGTPPFFKE